MDWSQMENLVVGLESDGRSCEWIKVSGRFHGWIGFRWEGMEDTVLTTVREKGDKKIWPDGILLGTNLIRYRYV
jgi:hypothetical protein